jgi:6-phosphogluconate dehydrogenase
MKLGMVGLGRMGANMTERLLGAGHQVTGYDSSSSARERVQAKGATTANSLAELVKQLRAPRIVWLMVPSGEPVDQTIQALTGELSAGDIIIDGGNSNYRDTLRRGEVLKKTGIRFVDAGVSGGIWGLAEGYSMMIGGDADVVARLTPIFEALAPAKDKGWGRVGPSGSGHFVKMVHNGIEYALMEAYAEGFELMLKKEEFNLDLAKIGEIWRFGSVVRSWLLDLITEALEENPKLEGIGAYVADSGEGRWTVVEGIDLGCPLPVISLALNRRFQSQEPEPFAEKLLATMRRKFGGHAVKAA